MQKKPKPVTQEETDTTWEILRRTDPSLKRHLSHDAAVQQLYPRLRLPKIAHRDGSMTHPSDTFEAAWSVIRPLKFQQQAPSRYDRLKLKQIEMLVRLLGYAQTGVEIAGVDRKAIVKNLLQAPGPSCRVYGWTFPEDLEIFEDPSDKEDRLMFAIMVQGGQYLDGVFMLEKHAALEVLKRSDLNDDVSAFIWHLVDPHDRGFLTTNDIVRMLRLMSRTSRGEHIHPRFFERPQPMLQEFDCLLSSSRRPPIPAPAEQSPSSRPLPSVPQCSNPPSPSSVAPALGLSPTPPIPPPSSPPSLVPVLSPVPQPASASTSASPQPPSSPAPQAPALPLQPSSSVAQSTSSVQDVASSLTLASSLPSTQEVTPSLQPAEVLPPTEDGTRSTILQEGIKEVVPTPDIPQDPLDSQTQPATPEQISGGGGHTKSLTTADLAALIQHFYQRFSKQHEEGPGDKNDPSPPEVPPRLRTEAAQSSDAAGGRIEAPGKAVASQAAPDSTSAAILFPPPEAPPLLALNGEILSPSPSTSVDRFSARPPQEYNLQNSLNRPVSPPPPSRPSASQEETQARSQCVGINNDEFPHSGINSGAPPPYSSLPLTTLEPALSTNLPQYPSGANNLYSQITISQGHTEHGHAPSYEEASHNRDQVYLAPLHQGDPHPGRPLPPPPPPTGTPCRKSGPHPRSDHRGDPGSSRAHYRADQLNDLLPSGSGSHIMDPEWTPAGPQSQYGAAIRPLPSDARGSQGVAFTAQPGHAYTGLACLSRTGESEIVEGMLGPPPYRP